MEFERLKTEVREIATIAESVPEPFRVRCFEILLDCLLRGQPSDEHASGDGKEERTPRGSGGGSGLRLPSQMRVFMQRAQVTEEDLGEILMIEDGEVHFVREPAETQVARGQIDWALLLALKNGIETNNLSADPEDVRSICQEKGYYDKGNFASIFKREPNAKLFRGEMKPQGEARPLTNEGQVALGELVKRMVRGS